MRFDSVLNIIRDTCRSNVERYVGQTSSIATLVKDLETLEDEENIKDLRVMFDIPENSGVTPCTDLQVIHLPENWRNMKINKVMEDYVCSALIHEILHCSFTPKYIKEERKNLWQLIVHDTSIPKQHRRNLACVVDCCIEVLEDLRIDHLGYKVLGGCQPVHDEGFFTKLMLDRYNPGIKYKRKPLVDNQVESSWEEVSKNVNFLLIVIQQYIYAKYDFHGANLTREDFRFKEVYDLITSQEVQDIVNYVTEFSTIDIVASSFTKVQLHNKNVDTSDDFEFSVLGNFALNLGNIIYEFIKKTVSALKSSDIQGKKGRRASGRELSNWLENEEDYENLSGDINENDIEEDSEQYSSEGDDNSREFSDNESDDSEEEQMETSSSRKSTDEQEDSEFDDEDNGSEGYDDLEGDETKSKASGSESDSSDTENEEEDGTGGGELEEEFDDSLWGADFKPSTETGIPDSPDQLGAGENDAQDTLKEANDSESDDDNDEGCSPSESRGYSRVRIHRDAIEKGVGTPNLTSMNMLQDFLFESENVETYASLLEALFEDEPVVYEHFKFNPKNVGYLKTTPELVIENFKETKQVDKNWIISLVVDFSGSMTSRIDSGSFVQMSKSQSRSGHYETEGCVTYYDKVMEITTDIFNAVELLNERYEINLRTQLTLYDVRGYLAKSVSSVELPTDLFELIYYKGGGGTNPDSGVDVAIRDLKDHNVEDDSNLVMLVLSDGAFNYNAMSLYENMVEEQLSNRKKAIGSMFLLPSNMESAVTYRDPKSVPEGEHNGYAFNYTKYNAFGGEAIPEIMNSLLSDLTLELVYGIKD